MPEPLTEFDRSLYEWQMLVPGFGEEGQRTLKAATVLVSRCGGVGGLAAQMLAAAGIGRLVLYHGGTTVPSDLNRQLLMTRSWIGRPRIDSIKKRLCDLNPDVEIVAVGENISPANAAAAVSLADVVVDCAPLFEERFALNHAAVILGKPMVDCAMFSLEGRITTIVPGKTPCLRCLHPQLPPSWKRQFPVFGAVSGLAACLGAMEVIKVLSGIGEPLYNIMLQFDMADMSFKRLRIRRNPRCEECGNSND